MVRSQKLSLLALAALLVAFAVPSASASDTLSLEKCVRESLNDTRNWRGRGGERVVVRELRLEYRIARTSAPTARGAFCGHMDHAECCDICLASGFRDCACDSESCICYGKVTLN